MTIVGYRRTVVAFAVFVALLTAVTVWLFIELKSQQVRLAHAAEDTKLFEEMRAKALQAEIEQAVGFLEYTVNHYPSGTKQEAGSRLDQMVESQRSSAVRDIIARLREKTGQDFGDDPRSWIERYIRE